MPLYSSKITIPNGHILIWHLTESLEELQTLAPKSILLKDLETIHHPQKKREWLGSKIVLKKLADLIGIPFSGTRKDEDGKPYLIGTPQEISITHSLNYVIAAIHPHPIGIDVERPSDKLIRVAKKFLSETEQHECQQDIEKLSQYWCAKEAIFKLNGKHGVSLRNDITLAPQIGATNHLIGNIHQQVCHIYLDRVEEYTLAIAQYQ